MYTDFDPVKLSLEENQFVLDHVGEPPVVAMGVPRPVQVTEAAVRPVLEGIYELLEREKHEGLKWVGVEAVKSAIRTYLEQSAKWEKNKSRRGAPRFPSMYSFDGRGKAHWRGIGSDSEFVRTYFDATGNRVPFAISLLPAREAAWKPEWITKESVEALPKITQSLVVNDDLHRIECFCGHTEVFREDSRSSYNAARARMSKHLRKSTDRIDDHRELHTNEFGS